jgi:hypothetical protein
LKRLLLICALFGLCVVGCGRSSDTGKENSNKTAAAAPSPAASPASTVQSNKPADPGGEKRGKESQGDVTGAYFPAEDLPYQFSEIEHLNLATIDENGSPAPLNGFIRPKRKSARDYQLVNPKLDGKNLTFTTSTVGGVGYSFKGTFERLDNFSANPPPSDQVILRGVLTKTADGLVVSETDVNFTYSAGG